MNDRPRRRRKKPKAGGQPSAGSKITLRRVPGDDAYELVFPPSVRRREADMEEVRRMLEAGETDVAVDELRWLLADCEPLLEAHRLLGEAALSDGDFALARVHFGYAFELGLKAIGREGPPGPMPYARPANRAFLESGKGLAWCLWKQGRADAAREVVGRLLRFDPSDPLRLGEMLK